MGKAILKAKKIRRFTGQDTALINGVWVVADYVDYNGNEYIVYSGKVYQEDNNGNIVLVSGLKPEDIGSGDSSNIDTSKSSFDFAGLFSSIGDLFGGIANFSSSITGKGTPNYNYWGYDGAGYGYGGNQQTNTWLLYGGLLLFVVLILFVLIKK